MNRLILVMAIASLLIVPGCSTGKPSEDKIKESIKKIMPIEPQITSVKELDYFPGLVEVIIKIDDKPVIFYTDRKGDYVVSGSILKAENKMNMTQELMKTLSPAQPAVPTEPATVKK